MSFKSLIIFLSMFLSAILFTINGDDSKECTDGHDHAAKENHEGHNHEGGKGHDHTVKEIHEGHNHKLQTICPVMGKDINKKYYVENKGKRIYACSIKCKKLIKKKFDKFSKALEDMEQSPETL